MELLSFYLLIPYAVLILVAFIVFYNAVKRPGLRWLNKVTVITLIVFTVIIFLPVLKMRLYFLPHVLPDGILSMLPKTLMLTISAILVLFYIISAIKLWKGGNTHVLKAVWIVIAVLSITDVVWQALLFLVYVPLFTRQDFSREGIFSTILIAFMLNVTIITPLFWAIISCMGLVKIRRENKRRLAEEMAS
ncbi:hypothetical protein [Niastella sp. OAS944]|uniref:hypothetical protein n=1 Tax=Niastella sp. OAS944 TaxID=2664089 RepID=UPI003482C176|nr:membrane-associated HD superfamily phosphohydrolase [Chitinophagaceae bacterium OAS944]